MKKIILTSLVCLWSFYIYGQHRFEITLSGTCSGMAAQVMLEGKRGLMINGKAVINLPSNPGASKAEVIVEWECCPGYHCADTHKKITVNFDFSGKACGYASESVIMNKNTYGVSIRYSAPIMTPPKQPDGTDLQNLCGNKNVTIQTTNHKVGDKYIWQVAKASGGPWYTFKTTTTNQTTINPVILNRPEFGFSNIFGKSLHIRVKPQSANDCGHYSRVSSQVLTIFYRGAPTDATFAITKPTCFGDSDGAITISNMKYVDGTVFNRQEILKHTLKKGNTTVKQAESSARSYTFTGLPAGNYTWQVESENGRCSTNFFNKTVADPPRVMAAVTATVPTTCFGDSDGSITLSISNGTPPFSYLVNGASTVPSNGSTTRAPVFTGLSAGSYTIETTDTNGCAANNITRSVTEPADITASATISSDYNGEDVSCQGADDAVITATASGGNGGYQYRLDGITGFQTQSFFTGVPVGTHTITVQDAKGCTKTSSPVTVSEPTAIIGSATATSPDCYEGDNGQIEVSASGGTGLLSYRLDGFTGFQLLPTFNGLTAGDYTVSVRDENGCVLSGITVQVTNPPAMEVTLSKTDVTCNGAGDGTINAAVTHGTPPYLYSKDDIVYQIFSTFGGLEPGTHTIWVQDANGCKASNSITINEPAVLTASITEASPVVCNGTPTGSLTAVESGGTGPYTYSWSNGDVGKTVTGLAAATYTVDITDANGCTASADYTLADPPVLVVSGNITSSYNGYHIACNGSADGAVDLSVSGGVPPYTYLWTNGSITQDPADLPAGTQSVTVTDQNGCEVVKSFELTQPAALTASIVTADALCNNVDDGMITVSASGGVSPLEYRIDGVTAYQPSNEFHGVSSGAYTLTVRDANLCELPGLIATVEEAVVVAFDLSKTDVTCGGGSDGAIAISVTEGNAPFSYSLDGSNFHSSPEFTGLVSGNYTVTVRDVNSCTTAADIFIDQPADLIVAIDESLSITCQGMPQGQLDATGSGGVPPYSYLWSNGATTQRISELLAGIYSVTITDDHGCTSEATYELTEPTLLTAVAEVSASYNGRDISCHGASDGAIDLSVAGGTPPYTYLWTTGETTEDISNLPAGYYAVEVRDSNNCLAEGNITLQEPDLLEMVLDSLKNPSCRGDANGLIEVSATGGTAAFQYSIDNGLSWQTAGLFTGLSSGTYQMMLRDVNGCETTKSFFLEDPEFIEVEQVTVTEPQCYGDPDGSLFIKARGGVTINNTGNYLYRIEHQNVPPDLPYDFEEVQEYIGEQVTFENLIAGDYNITIYDHYGCSGTLTVTIATVNKIGLTLSTQPVVCKTDANGSATVSLTGGVSPYHLMWYHSQSGKLLQDEMVNEGNLAELMGLEEGLYHIRVIDANGCELYASGFKFDIASPVESLRLEAETYNNISCYGANDGLVILKAYGGWQSQPYLYGTSLDNLSSGNRFYENLIPGNYIYYVQDAAGCITFLDVVIDEPDPLASSIINMNMALCHDDPSGSIELEASGGTSPYYVSMDGGQTWIENLIIDNLSAGHYNVLLKDGNGCTNVHQTDITEPPLLELSITELVHPVCDNSSGSISVSANGGKEPYDFKLIDENNNLVSQQWTTEGLSAGIYTAEVIDANGCTQAFSAEIMVSSKLNILVESSPVGCYGGANGSATVNIPDGNPPYTVQWSNGQTGTTATGLIAGKYMVTVSDADHCEVSGEVTVFEPEELSFEAQEITNANCYGGCNGSIKVQAAGGTGSYQYLLSTGEVTTTGAFSHLCAGNYALTITDANGCSYTQDYILTQPARETLTLGGPSVICSNQRVTLDAGVGESYIWASDNGFTNDQRVVQLAEAGYYEVWRTAADGCEAYGSFELSVSEESLLPELLLASEANVGDTVIVIDITWPRPDSSRLLIMETVTQFSSEPYVNHLIFHEPGNYTVELASYIGACSYLVSEDIVIYPQAKDNETGRTAGAVSDIKEVNILPNPNNGQFTADIVLTQEMAVHVRLISMSGNQTIVERYSKGQQEYSHEFNLKGKHGIFILVVETERSRVISRVIVN